MKSPEKVQKTAVAEIEAAPENEAPVKVTGQEAPAAAATSTAAVAVTADSAAAASVSVKTEPSATVPIPAQDPSDISRLGEEDLPSKKAEVREQQEEVYYATVVEVSKGRNKVLYFHFDNGQVWRQIEGRNATTYRLLADAFERLGQLENAARAEAFAAQLEATPR